MKPAKKQKRGHLFSVRLRGKGRTTRKIEGISLHAISTVGMVKGPRPNKSPSKTGSAWDTGSRRKGSSAAWSLSTPPSTGSCTVLTDWCLHRVKILVTKWKRLNSPLHHVHSDQIALFVLRTFPSVLFHRVTKSLSRRCACPVGLIQFPEEPLTVTTTVSPHTVFSAAPFTRLEWPWCHYRRGIFQRTLAGYATVWRDS